MIVVMVQLNPSTMVISFLLPEVDAEDNKNVIILVEHI